MRKELGGDEGKRAGGTKGNEERRESESATKGERRGERDAVSVHYDSPLPKQELIQ